MSTLESVASVIREHKQLDGAVVESIHDALIGEVSMEDIAEAIEILQQVGRIKRHVNTRTSRFADAVDQVIWIED